MAEFEQVLLAYVAAWNEADEGKRRTLLETSWAEHGTYIDPTAQVAGREALVQHLGKLIQQFPEHRVLLTSGADTHHDLLRFTWARVGADGREIRKGIDFGELAVDGRLLRITGFFDLPQLMPTTRRFLGLEEGKTVATPPKNIRFINPSALATAPGYTHVVEITQGRTVFISGQVALDPAGAIVGQRDFRAQTQQVFENLKAALAAVGADFTCVVKLNIYVVDISQLLTLREVRDQYVNTDNPPASTLVEVRKLAREDFLIEVEAVAHLPE